MRKVTGIIPAILLELIGWIHVYWGFGGVWPAANRQEFLNMFWGQTSPMSGLWTGIFIGLMLVIASLYLAARAVDFPIPGPLKLWNTALVFLLGILAFRGLAGYLPIFSGELEPYITLNKTIYSPLCLSISILGGISLFLGKREKENRNL